MDKPCRPYTLTVSISQQTEGKPAEEGRELISTEETRKSKGTRGQ